jgi:putative tryptophan/tyrosine transport system substrate-binding protein
MQRRDFITAIGSLAAIEPFAAHAQQGARRAHIAYFALARTNHLVQAFLQGLADLGYVDGHSIAIQYHFAEGNLGKLDELATNIVRSAPEVIVAVGIVAGFALKCATRSIPIVLAPAGDPLQAGW